MISYFYYGKGVSNDLSVNADFDICKSLCGIMYATGECIKQNSPLWFLPALFSAQVIYYVIIKFIEKKQKNHIYVFFIIFTVALVFSSYVKFLLPWGGVSQTFTLGIFIFLGRYLNLMEGSKNIVKIYMSAMIGMVALFSNSTVNYMSNEYGSYVLFIISSIGLSMIFIHISIYIKKNKLLEFIGKNTMQILIFHKLPIVFFQSKAGCISEFMRNSNIVYELSICIVVSFISIVFCLLVSFLFKKFSIAFGER